MTVPHSQLSALLETASSLKIKGRFKFYSFVQYRLIVYCLNLGVDDHYCAGKHNQQFASPGMPTKSNATLPNIDPVTVRSITQMPTQSQPRSWKNSELVMNKETDYDSDGEPQHFVANSPIQECGVVCEQDSASPGIN